MNENTKIEYKNFLLENFDIVLDDENEKYFLGARNFDNCTGSGCAKLFAFKGSPLISFLVCEKKIEGIDFNDNLGTFTYVQEKYIDNEFLKEIFEIYGFEKFICYKKSKEISDGVKNGFIKALIYATYKSFNIDKAWEVFDKMLKKHSSETENNNFIFDN